MTTHGTVLDSYNLTYALTLSRPILYGYVITERIKQLSNPTLTVYIEDSGLNGKCP